MAAGHTTLWLQEQSRAGPDPWGLQSPPEVSEVLRDSGASDSGPGTSSSGLASVRR